MRGGLGRVPVLGLRGNKRVNERGKVDMRRKGEAGFSFTACLVLMNDAEEWVDYQSAVVLTIIVLSKFLFYNELNIYIKHTYPSFSEFLAKPCPLSTKTQC